MKSLKRSILWMTLLALVLAGGGGCTPEGEIPTATEEADSSIATPLPGAKPPSDDEFIVTIRFAVQENYRGKVDTFVELAAEFHEQNPSIRVDVVEMNEVIGSHSGDYVLRLVSGVDTAESLVSGYDVSRGLLRDLSPFIEADGSFEPDDFYHGMLEAFQWQGGTWALPTQAFLTLIYYDVQAFAESGVPRPTPDWTRDGFLAAAQALTVRQNGDVVRYGFLGEGGRQAFVLGAAGDLAGASPRVDTPAIADAVRWYTDLTLVHGVSHERWMDLAPSDVEDGDWSIGDLVRDGRVAMWSSWFSGDPDMWVCTIPQMEEEGCDGKIGVAVFPTENGLIAPAHMYGYLMSAGTAYPQESWRWLRFLSRQSRVASEYQEGHSMGIYKLPARRSVAEESGYFDRFDGEVRQVLEAASEHLYVAPWSEATRQLTGVISDVFDGAEVEAALAEAQVALDEALAEAARATPVPVVVAAPQPEGEKITFAPQFDADQDAHRSLAGAFNVERAGDVQVQVVAPSRAESADCFGGPLDLDYESGREGRLNLQSMVDGDAGFPLDDFHPRFLEAARYQGDLWAVPTSAQVRVVFYNRDLFDAAGEPCPAPGWTLAEFLTHALALTVGSGDDKVYGFLPLNGHQSDLHVFLALQGADLWDEEGWLRFDAPGVVAAARWYADLALAHGVMPIFADDGAAQDERRALVRDGRVAMWTDFAGNGDPWPPGADVGMAPLPLAEAGAEGVIDAIFWGLFVSDDAADPQACWEWIKLLSAQSELVHGLPARGSVLESPEFAARAGEEAVAAYREMIAYADLWDAYPATPDGRARWQLLHEAFESILAGADPETALAEAQQNAGD